MRLILVTGKGGAGTTTAAAATAAVLAAGGRKALVLSAGGSRSLADAVGVPLDDRPRELDTGLAAAQFDPQDRFERSWPRAAAAVRALLAHTGGAEPDAGELPVVPGVAELLALLHVRDQVARGPWEAVVVDAGPAAAALRLLALPDSLHGYLEFLLPTHQRMLRAAAGAEDDLLAAAGTLHDELADLRALLGAADVTSARVVLTPEAMALAESRRIRTALALHRVRLDAVLVNRVVPAGQRSRWAAGLAAGQRPVLAQARTAFAGVPLATAGWRATGPVGVAELLDLGRELYADLDPLGGDAGGDVEPAAEVVDRDGDGFLLRLPLPFADRADLHLARAGDALVVTVAGQRRVLPLPSGLRRCRSTGATLVDGELRIRFEPDPALWPREREAL